MEHNRHVSAESNNESAPFSNYKFSHISHNRERRKRHLFSKRIQVYSLLLIRCSHLTEIISMCVIVFIRMRNRQSAENHPRGIRSWLRYPFTHNRNSNSQPKPPSYEKANKHDKREAGRLEHGECAIHQLGD